MLLDDDIVVRVGVHPSWLQGNPQLTGTIPTEIGRLTQITSSM
jgi:hypothetical protein